MTRVTRRPRQRFSDRVEHYVRSRPGYPSEPLSALAAETGLGDCEGFHSVAGASEQPGLPGDPVDLITAAQAFSLLARLSRRLMLPR